MPNYMCRWGILVEAQNPEEAARLAKLKSLDPDHAIWHISNLDTLESTIIDFGKERIIQRAKLMRELEGLKRAGRLEEARQLGLRMVADDERVAIGCAPFLWTTWETAIILRKLKDTKAEINLLERYIRNCPPGTAPVKIVERLERLRNAKSSPTKPA